MIMNSIPWFCILFSSFEKGKNCILFSLELKLFCDHALCDICVNADELFEMPYVSIDDWLMYYFVVDVLWLCNWKRPLDGRWITTCYL